MSSNNKWTLGGEPPEPQVWEDAEQPETARENVEGFTGTDPLGRAVGPNEDHTQVKKVRNEKGEVVTPKATTRKK